MKKIIISQSVHKGCTANIAAAMSEIPEAEVLNPDDVSQEDIAGFGSGIYAGKFTQHVSAC